MGRRLEVRDPLELAVLGATALLEVRDGRRDASQLDGLVDRRVARQLAALVRRRRGADGLGGAPTLRRVVVDASHDGRVNVVVVLDCPRRVLAVCVEVQAARGRGDTGWRITALGTPEDHGPDDLEPERPHWERPSSVEPW